MQFATNHLGHFALTLGLRDALAAARDARVVSLSSEAHLRAPLDFDDLNFVSRPYDWMLTYGQSKTANALFAVEAARRWAGDGIAANAVHPGAVIETRLARDLDSTCSRSRSRRRDTSTRRASRVPQQACWSRRHR